VQSRAGSVSGRASIGLPVLLLAERAGAPFGFDPGSCRRTASVQTEAGVIPALRHQALSLGVDGVVGPNTFAIVMPWRSKARELTISGIR